MIFCCLRISSLLFFSSLIILCLSSMSLSISSQNFLTPFAIVFAILRTCSSSSCDNAAEQA